jgi:hypothetical protein
MMRLIIKLIGLALIIGGVYLLGENIYFVTNSYPYWWRGVAADGSILFLTFGVLLFFTMPKDGKFLAAGAIAIGIILVFISSRAVLKPTTLWHFVGSLACFIGGYQLMTTGRINL